jgi:hypothetical protein
MSRKTADGEPGEGLQRGPHALPGRLQAVQVTHRADHMGGVGPLPTTRGHQPLGAAVLQQPVEDHPFHTVIGQPGTELRQHREAETGIVRLDAIAYFQSMARTAIAAACRSVRSSANCSTVTNASTPGDSAGAPRTPNAAANGSSENTS